MAGLSLPLTLASLAPPEDMDNSAFSDSEASTDDLCSPRLVQSIHMLKAQKQSGAAALSASALELARREVERARDECIRKQARIDELESDCLRVTERLQAHMVTAAKEKDDLEVKLSQTQVLYASRARDAVSEADQLKAQIAQLEASEAKLKGECEEYAERVTTLTKQRDQLEASTASLCQEVSRLQDALKVCRDGMGEVEKDRNIHEERLLDAKGVISKLEGEIDELKRTGVTKLTGIYDQELRKERERHSKEIMKLQALLDEACARASKAERTLADVHEYGVEIVAAPAPPRPRQGAAETCDAEVQASRAEVVGEVEVQCEIITEADIEYHKSLAVELRQECSHLAEANEHLSTLRRMDDRLATLSTALSESFDQRRELERIAERAAEVAALKKSVPPKGRGVSPRRSIRLEDLKAVPRLECEGGTTVGPARTPARTLAA